MKPDEVKPAIESLLMEIRQIDAADVYEQTIKHMYEAREAARKAERRFRRPQ